MKKQLYYIWIFIVSIFFNFDLSAQEIEEDPIVESDTLKEKKGVVNQLINYFEEAKKDKTSEKIDLSFIGGPSYSVDTKLGLGILASGLYKIDRQDTILPPSDVSVYSNITTSGFFSVGIENHSIFPNDDYRVNLSLSFSYMPTEFYGIGYEAGTQGVFTKYDQYETSFETDLLKRLWKHTYAGVNITLKNNNNRKFRDPDLQPEGDRNSFIFGGGLLLTYDSRDFIPNPSKGFYFKYEENFYPGFLGNNNHFREAFVTARMYQKLWKKATMAIDLNGIVKTGDVPWSMLSMVGGSQQMRGYYTGRYRDKKQVNAQVELRQKIHNRHGAVAWLGMGKVFEHINTLSLKHLLPNYGVGYRWEFKNRVNIRLDYGIGRDGGGFYFNVNEAF